MDDDNSNAQQQFYGNGTVWITSVSSWSGKDKLTAADIGKRPEDILDIIELGRKKIVPEDQRVKLMRPSSQITSLMSALGKRFFIRGAWYVPNNHFLLAKNGLEKIRENQAVIVEDLVANMPEIKEEMIEKYPLLKNAVWPTDKQIQNRFSVKWEVCEIHGAEINEADPKELVAAKIEFQKQLTESYEEYKEQILMQAKIAIIDACHGIAKKIEEGQKITEHALKKPKRVIEDYQNIAEIFDLEDVKAEVSKLRAELEATEARELRDDWEFAQGFADTMQAMAENIGDLSGLSSDGTVKRVVRKAA